VRVALLTHNARDGDAIGNLVAEKIGFFVDRGADVRVLLESDKRLHPVVRPHCRVLRVPEPHADDWRFLASTDLVIVEYGQYYRLLELLPLLTGDRPRILFNYHGVTPIDLWGGQNQEPLEMGIRQGGLVWCADAALVHSRFSREELRGRTAFPAERCSVLRHPVDTNHFCPGRPQRDVRDLLGIPGATLLLFVGRLAPNKRVPILVEALDQLRDLTPQVHLAVLGDSTDVYEIEAQRCRQRAAELGLDDRIHIFGHVRERQLLDAYRSADLFVMPSRHEGFCIPVLEAMACGLPVVAARAGALPETVAGAGLTFAVDDPDDLARQIRRVLVRSEISRNCREPLAERMRRQGLLWAAQHDRSAWRERFGRIVEELLDRPRRTRRQELEVRPRTHRRIVSAGSDSLLVSVRVANRGTHAVLPEGPGGMVLRAVVADEFGQSCGLRALDTPLPELLIPGQERPAVMRVPVPATTGVYQVAFFAVSRNAEDAEHFSSAKSSFRLLVEPKAVNSEDLSCAAWLQSVHSALIQAGHKQRLPIDYIDVTEGFLAKWKRWIKHKLLGNFKHAYVDVLSRQQSAFNSQTLIALQELVECCALLDHAVAAKNEGHGTDTAKHGTRPSAGDASSLTGFIERTVAAGDAGEFALLVHNLLERIVETEQRIAALEARVNQPQENERFKAQGHAG
jgi:glycosyltransferase involved in cell wall biosynthesis